MLLLSPHLVHCDAALVHVGPQPVVVQDIELGTGTETVTVTVTEPVTEAVTDSYNNILPLRLPHPSSAVSKSVPGAPASQSPQAGNETASHCQCG